MKLDVPIQHQKKGDFNCSIAVAHMVLTYWGVSIQYEKLVQELSSWVNENERHIEGVGIFLARQGYKVRLSHHDAGVLSKDIDKVTEEDKEKLINVLKNLPGNDGKANFRRRKLELAVELIESGGGFSTEIPSLELLDRNLSSQVPTIICISQRVWTTSPDVQNNHYVVVVGKGDSTYIVNDPNPNTTSPYHVNKNRLLMAWYATGAYTLAMEPK